MRWAFCKRADVLDEALARLACGHHDHLGRRLQRGRVRGNPAAVCLLRQPLDDGRMQSIVFELGIAETAYLTPTDDPTVFGLRWFSPAVEIDLCGHATLASAARAA